MKLPCPLRTLGTCGLASSVLCMIGGFAKMPALIGAGGAVMVAGNLYAMSVKKV